MRPAPGDVRANPVPDAWRGEADSGMSMPDVTLRFRTQAGSYESCLADPELKHVPSRWAVVTAR